MEKHIINTSFYNREVYLIEADTAEKASTFINETWKDNFDKINMKDDCRGFQWETTCPSDIKGFKARFYIYIHPLEYKNTTVEHELIHLTWAILEYIGIVVTQDNHEAFTYFYEYLLNQVREIIATITSKK